MFLRGGHVERVWGFGMGEVFCRAINVQIIFKKWSSYLSIGRNKEEVVYLTTFLGENIRNCTISIKNLVNLSDVLYLLYHCVSWNTHLDNKASFLITKKDKLIIFKYIYIYIFFLKKYMKYVETYWWWFRTVQFSSVPKSCPTLPDPMDHSMPGLPANHQLLESTQTHLHWVSDGIQPSQS